MMKFNKKRLSVSIAFFVLVVVLLLFINMNVFTLSRYQSTMTAQNSIRTAIYLLNDTYQTVNVKLPDIIPSNRQYTYTFSVSNFNGDEHSDTNLKYRVHIRTTTNIELEYDLFKTLDIDDAESCVTSDEIVQDYYGTHFRHIYNDYSTMLYTEDATDYYTILISFPSSMFPTPSPGLPSPSPGVPTPSPNYRLDSRYSGLAEMIEINIESSQILQNDT